MVDYLSFEELCPFRQALWSASLVLAVVAAVALSSGSASFLANIHEWILVAALATCATAVRSFTTFFALATWFAVVALLAFPTT